MKYERSGAVGVDGPFRCVEKPKIVFISTEYASKCIFNSGEYSGKIARAVRTGKPFRGYHFEYIEFNSEAEDSYIFD